MKKTSHLSVIAMITIATAMAGAAAQTSGPRNDPSLDLAAIRARAAQASDDAEALAASARARAETLADEARTNAAGAEAHRRRFTGVPAKGAQPGAAPTFDFDRMVADAGTIARDGMGEAPRFIAFASLAMPPEALRAMIADVTRAGGVVALRGLPGGSAKALTAALAKVARPGEKLEGLGIDPRLFRAFAVTAAPTYIVTASDFDLCDGFACASTVPPHDRLSGNVSAAYALETIAEGGGPGARIAAQHRARLEGRAP